MLDKIWRGKPEPGNYVSKFGLKFALHWLRHRWVDMIPLLSLWMLTLTARQAWMKWEYGVLLFEPYVILSTGVAALCMVCLGAISHMWWARDSKWADQELEHGYGRKDGDDEIISKTALVRELDRRRAELLGLDESDRPRKEPYENS